MDDWMMSEEQSERMKGSLRQHYWNFAGDVMAPFGKVPYEKIEVDNYLQSMTRFAEEGVGMAEQAPRVAAFMINLEMVRRRKRRLKKCRPVTCCMAGTFHWESDWSRRIAPKLRQTLRELIEEGYRYFLCGMGPDDQSVGAWEVVKLREEYPQIKLILVFSGHYIPEDWTEKERAGLGDLLEQTDKIIYTSLQDEETNGYCRNCYMIDHSSMVVTWPNGSYEPAALEGIDVNTSAHMMLYALEKDVDIKMVYAEK